MSQEKPGIKTTEFWMTLAAQAVAVGVMTGYITPGQGEIVNEAVPVVAGGVISVCSGVIYTISRIAAKRKDG